jgi:hypothetical protein
MPGRKAFSSIFWSNRRQRTQRISTHRTVVEEHVSV